MKWFLLLPLVVFVAACAHHNDVRPGADGIHRVVVLGNGEGDGERNAISQANHYCKEEKNLAAVFMNEATAYQGDLDEATNRTVRNASKAAGVVGSGMSVFGGRRENNAGQAAMGAGAVGGIMTRNTYKTEMQFQCK